MVNAPAETNQNTRNVTPQIDQEPDRQNDQISSSSDEFLNSERNIFHPRWRSLRSRIEENIIDEETQEESYTDPDDGLKRVFMMKVQADEDTPPDSRIKTHFEIHQTVNGDFYFTFQRYWMTFNWDKKVVAWNEDEKGPWFNLDEFLQLFIATHRFQRPIRDWEREYACRYGDIRKFGYRRVPRNGGGTDVEIFSNSAVPGGNQPSADQQYFKAKFNRCDATIFKHRDWMDFITTFDKVRSYPQ